MAKANDSKILTNTAKKVIIKINRINEVLNENEVKLFKNFLDKMENYDKAKKEAI